MFPDLSLEEAYLLLNVYLRLDFSLNAARQIDQERITAWDPWRAHTFTVADMNGNCSTQVTRIGNMCIISTSCSC
ncbi:MAG: hypothetical protein JNK89_06110 [Saprospiraceae bacterium]|nr:hypothetical protein [Saprospiraceae bacterium]